MTPLGLGAAVSAADLEIYKKFPVLDVFWTLKDPFTKFDIAKMNLDLIVFMQEITYLK